MLRVLVTGLLLVLAGCAATGSGDSGVSADERLRALYEREFAWRQGEEGYFSDEDGDWVRGPAWPDAARPRGDPENTLGPSPGHIRTPRHPSQPTPSGWAVVVER